MESIYLYRENDREIEGQWDGASSMPIKVVAQRCFSEYFYLCLMDQTDYFTAKKSFLSNRMWFASFTN